MRSLVFNIPTIEKEVQNALESLFIGIDLCKSVDIETGKYNFSGREYIPDFILPKLNLCIEVKLLKEPKKNLDLLKRLMLT